MRQLSASLLALVLGAAAATALASCGGGSNADLLPGDTAREITANLGAVEQLADSGDCAGAQSAALQVGDQIDALGGVDKELKQALRDGADRLNEVVATCVETTTEAIAPASIPETTESTKSKPPKAEEEKEEKAEEKQEEDEADEAPTPPGPPVTTPPGPPGSPPGPPEGGGTGAPGGVSPGSAVGEGE